VGAVGAAFDLQDDGAVYHAVEERTGAPPPEFSSMQVELRYNKEGGLALPELLFSRQPLTEERSSKKGTKALAPRFLAQG
jgi:hypothetical protein